LLKKNQLCLIFGLFLLVTTMGLAQQYPPAVMHSALLENVKLKSDNGWFHMEGMQAVFLPDPVRQSKMIYPYNPQDGGKLDAVLKRADGGVVATFHFYGEKRKAPYWLLNSNELEGGSRTDLRLTEPGDYTLEFSIEGKPFQQFPFKVVTKESGDPYHPGTTYLLDGDWNRYGYLYYADAVPSRPLEFKMWLRGMGASRPSKVMVDLLDSAGKVLASSQTGGTSYSLRPEWVRYAFTLRTERTFLPASDVLSKPGSYLIRVSMDGQLYGEYPFQVSDQKIVKGERQATSSSLTHIEGGADSWWLEKR
jgi:hypothetical protein